MNAHERELGPSLVERVVGCAYRVSNTLGAGFLEKVYERALVVELTHVGLAAVAQPQLNVRYRGEVVGQYSPDVLVEEALIVELKCVDDFTNDHLAQCLNYLKATGLTESLLINFKRPRVQWRRVVLGQAR